MSVADGAARTALFRFDAGPGVGGGHAMRCLTLADALETEGWRCRFAVAPGTLETVARLAVRSADCLVLDGNDEPQAMAAFVGDDGADVTVVDHYDWSAGRESSCREFSGKIMIIDDLANRPHDCDLLLDQNLGRETGDYVSLVPDRCKLLLGPGHALLKPEFAALRDATLRRRAEMTDFGRLLIAFGLTDPDNLTARALDAVRRTEHQFSVIVVLGGGAPHLDEVRELASRLDPPATVIADADDMAELVARADLGIGACGTTSWERCCLGLPTIALTAADNQRAVARHLDEIGAVVSLGWHADVDAAAIAREIRGFAHRPDRARTLAEAASAVCDGLGAHRVVEVLRDA